MPEVLPFSQWLSYFDGQSLPNLGGLLGDGPARAIPKPLTRSKKRASAPDFRSRLALNALKRAPRIALEEKARIEAELARTGAQLQAAGLEPSLIERLSLREREAKLTKAATREALFQEKHLKDIELHQRLGQSIRTIFL